MNKLLNPKMAILSGLLLSACGGGGSDSTDTDTSEPLLPPNTAPVADAGTDITVSRHFTVNLDASNSSDADGDALSYTWTQTAGPDITGGAGSLSGVTPAFIAPAEVDTVILELVVNDGTDDSATDTIVINVLEDVNVAYFVDGDSGDDSTGTGSSDNPFASIAKALCEVTGDQQDIYVKNRTGNIAYDETTDPCPDSPARETSEVLSIPTGTSLYGGYGENWIREHQTLPTMVNTLHHGFRFVSVAIDAWFSGFDVDAADSPAPSSSVYALYASGSAALTVSDNDLNAGDVGFGNAANPGNSFGIALMGLNSITVERNNISAGAGGSGLDVGNTFATEAASGAKGANASGTTFGLGGAGGGPEGNGGARGGTPGREGGQNGTTGNNGKGPAGDGGCGGGVSSGGYDCAGENSNGDAGRNGQNGGQGADGSAGNGGPGDRIIPATGSNGNVARDGGGAGGGGGGGAGGAGGPGGPDGGASIGLYLFGINTALVDDNFISSGLGGNGATGGQGQVGGDGGASGAGGDGNNGTFGGSGGDGGNGGVGGKGGTGGRGGAGGGGPSYGIAVSAGLAPAITNNQITSGNGGFGGFGGDGGFGGTGGFSYSIFDADINDGLVPVLINNTLIFGTAGNGGGTSGTGGSNGSAGEAGGRNW